jgi:hypothetical protein
MIKFTWEGPLTAYKNRVLTPGRSIELERADPQTKTWEAMGYLKPIARGSATADSVEKPEKASETIEKPAEKHKKETK